ncbi:type III secretion protein [Pseudomonas mucidolens]|uniref:type III secretion protein n=1 Tax=Pseudomonas mucidolens TaxID=46679 RepID=UPI0030DDC9D6
MNDELSWVRWWAHAWKEAHTDWLPQGLAAVKPESLQNLAQARHMSLAHAFAIEPCQPLKPHPAHLRFVLAAPYERQVILQRVEAACRPQVQLQLSEDEGLWCCRIAKAMNTESWLAPTDDPLQLLRAWVAAQCWQRLRVSFARERILELEQARPLLLSPAKLDALWQAVIWRTLSSRL